MAKARKEWCCARAATGLLAGGAISLSSLWLIGYILSRYVYTFTGCSIHQKREGYGYVFLSFYVWHHYSRPNTLYEVCPRHSQRYVDVERYFFATWRHGTFLCSIYTCGLLKLKSYFEQGLVWCLCIFLSFFFFSWFLKMGFCELVYLVKWFFSDNFTCWLINWVPWKINLKIKK